MNLKTQQLSFKYPPELVATKAQARGESRIYLIPKKAAHNTNESREISWLEFYKLFKPGDLLILNNTKVIKARLLQNQKEIFFLKTLSSLSHWQVLTKGYRLKEGKEILLPGDLKAKIVKTGRPCEILLSKQVDIYEYLNTYGHVPLPPYILQLRSSHSDEPEDLERYQTIWAKADGSVAAPTASLHFGESQLDEIKKQGVEIDFITLHVGAGTFLPIDTENILDFKMHSEKCFISQNLIKKIIQTKNNNGRVWACGTTVVRALETWGLNYDFKNRDQWDRSFEADTDIFIKPNFNFKIVDALLTNFHQPESTLLLLVSAFCGQGFSEQNSIDKIINAYQKAIELKFRLFSYGDLTVMV